MFALRYNPAKPKKINQQHVGRFASVSASSNGDADFCGALAYDLDFWGDNVWVVLDRQTAEAAAATNTPWYNAEYTTPQNDHPGDWDVVEMEVK